MKKRFIAREFRNNPTRSEKILWEAIRRRKINNLKFLRQYVAEGYIVDFYCSKLHLAIEVDGGIHLLNIESDKQRMMVLEKTGIRFFRISAELIENELDTVIKNLENFISNLPK